VPGAVIIVLVREAGGFVTDYRGGGRMIERNELLAGNAHLHLRLRKLVVKALLQLRRVRWQG
jgi:myo-inositol-1(or 4)-monophosphatase